MSNANAKQYLNALACLTMPLEGVLFFGLIYGWPNIAEIYKKMGVYESLCDLGANTTAIVNGVVNCPERDKLFTYVNFNRIQPQFQL